MSLATRSPHDAMQVSESEQNLSVGCLNRLTLAFTDNCQVQGYQGSRSSLFPNAQNVVISGGRFIVSLSCGRYKRLIIVHIRMFYAPILKKRIRGSLYFKNQIPVHCLSDGKMYSTSFGRFLFMVLMMN